MMNREALIRAAQVFFMVTAAAWAGLSLVGIAFGFGWVFAWHEDPRGFAASLTVVAAVAAAVMDWLGGD
jgi:hypothetical protein